MHSLSVSLYLLFLGNYKSAREKLKKAEETSDLGTDREKNYKRRYALFNRNSSCSNFQ